MSKRGWGFLIGAGCLVIVLFLAAIVGLVFWVMPSRQQVLQPTVTPQAWTPPLRRATAVPPAVPVPTLAPQPRQQAPLVPQTEGPLGAIDSGLLSGLYQELNPGVVTIQVTTAQGSGTGSGFVIDTDGHIVTNNHVVAAAERVFVVFFDGIQVPAEVLGTDDDSDLAVLKVDELPAGVHPLGLGDSDEVQVGQWVIAIGGPFGLGSTMTVGIVSFEGRTIASGVTPFSIPQAIQTDAAINPGNSGGPLLNLRGEVVGVNAQIATGDGSRSNAGVGFAIPVNVVRKVAPVLIEHGVYEWPWLGVQGSSVGYYLAKANELDSQFGAYIAAIVTDGPAAAAEMQGTTSTVQIDGIEVPYGGDVVVAIDDVEIRSFDDLLAEVSAHDPGDTVMLSVIRGGRTIQVEVTLAARPQQFN